jgi:hypothetical protein
MSCKAAENAQLLTTFVKTRMLVSPNAREFVHASSVVNELETDMHSTANPTRRRARFANLGRPINRHTFSFGHYFDPERMGFGPLRVRSL